MPTATRRVPTVLVWILNIAWALNALVLAFAVLLLVLSPFARAPLEVDASWLSVGLNSQTTIPVSFSLDMPVRSASLGIDHAEVQNARGSLRLPTPKGAFLVANMIALIALSALALWVIGQLRAVIRTLRDGRPFVDANATRIRRVAFGVMAAELLRSTVVLFENRYAQSHFSAAGLRFDAWPDLDVTVIVVGAIILVIAEVFRLGTRLDEEQSLTV